MFKTVSSIALAVAVVPAVALGSGQGLSHSLKNPDVTVLIGQATKLVRAKPGFSKAVLLEADGTPSKSGKVNTASANTKWRYVFKNQGTPKFTFRSAFINYSNGRFGKLVPKKSPFVEDKNIAKVPKMTLATAVSKLKAAGYKAGFYGVTLRYPLGPGFKEALYIFTMGSQAPDPYVDVGTKSGKVKPIS
jgi:hypothetical protein